MLAIEQRFVTGTYLSLRGPNPQLSGPGTVGAFQIDADQPPQNRVIYSGSRKNSRLPRTFDLRHAEQLIAMIGPWRDLPGKPGDVQL